MERHWPERDASNQKFKGEPNDIVHDALFILSLDALCVHRAVGTLVDAGWSSPASILLRTLLDFTISALAIRHSSEPTIAAFTFLYSGSRKVARDQSPSLACLLFTRAPDAYDELMSADNTLMSAHNRLVSAENRLMSAHNRLMSMDNALMSADTGLMFADTGLMSTDKGLMSMDNRLRSTDSGLLSTDQPPM